jgi:hypothetical protein
MSMRLQRREEITVIEFLTREGFLKVIHNWSAERIGDDRRDLSYTLGITDPASGTGCVRQ